MILSAIAFQAGARSVETAPAPEAGAAADARDDGFPLFSFADAEPASVVEPATAAPLPEPEPEPEPFRPRLAVIIDDVADLRTAERIWEIGALTVSVLPYADEAPAIAARAGDREVFLHLPMEPVGLEDPGPYALTKSLEGERLDARLAWALSRVPGASGFNNHMGSRMTADPEAMIRLFSALDGRQDELIFVDSLTHPASVARETALEAGFSALDRDVFLDHDPARAAVERQISTAIRLAVAQGEAIAIGHPRETTLDALQDLALKADAAGVDLVPVSALTRD